MAGALNRYCSHASPCEAFFVSAAQRKSQKTREKRRQTAFYAVCVHRGACYWAQPGGGVNSNQFRKEALIMKRHFLPHAACALFLGVCLALLPGMQTDPALAQEAAVMSSSAAGYWGGDGEDWKYFLPDGAPLKKSWLRSEEHTSELQSHAY